MNRIAALLLVAALAAQAAADTPPLDVFLEQRVAEELAADGTILSRLGVALDVELVGDKAVVSLVDPATRRAVSSTKVDSLPADREAAVATVVQIVANMTTQLNANNSTAAAVKGALEEERKARDERESRELAYKHEAITFSDVFITSTDGKSSSTARAMFAYRGDRQLSTEDFFVAVERPDLADRFHRRKTIGRVTTIAGSVVLIGGATLALVKGLPHRESYSGCDPFSSMFEACIGDVDRRNDKREDEAAKWRTYSYITMGAGAVIGGVGLYFLLRANPVSESEAHDLADEHNAKLRKKYQLPEPKTVVTPYASPEGGGLALVGTF